MCNAEPPLHDTENLNLPDFSKSALQTLNNLFFSFYQVIRIYISQTTWLCAQLLSMILKSFKIN